MPAQLAGSERASGAAAPRPRLRGWLHGAAVPFAVAGLWGMSRLVTHLPPLERLPALLYGVSMVGLFAVSALYHIPRWWSRRAREVLLRLDGAATVLLIVGTFVPVAAYTLDGAWQRWSLLGALAVALVGAVLALTKFGTPRVSAAAYVAAGWLAAIPMPKIAAVLPGRALSLIVAGGVVYSIGALVYARQRPGPASAWFGYHELFHALVVVAAALHYAAVWWYVLPLVR